MSRSGDSKRAARPLIRILPGAKDYPASLSTCGIQIRLNGIGEASLLRSPVLALFCSVKCPGSIVLKTYEAMQGLKLEDRVIAGGFHSPMERTCLDILLRGRTKLIVCPARDSGRSACARNGDLRFQRTGFCSSHRSTTLSGGPRFPWRARGTDSWADLRMRCLFLSRRVKAGRNNLSLKCSPPERRSSHFLTRKLSR